MYCKCSIIPALVTISIRAFARSLLTRGTSAILTCFSHGDPCRSTAPSLPSGTESRLGNWLHWLGQVSPVGPLSRIAASLSRCSRAEKRSHEENCPGTARVAGQSSRVNAGSIRVRREKPALLHLCRHRDWLKNERKAYYARSVGLDPWSTCQTCQQGLIVS